MIQSSGTVRDTAPEQSLVGDTDPERSVIQRSGTVSDTELWNSKRYSSGTVTSRQYRALEQSVIQSSGTVSDQHGQEQRITPPSCHINGGGGGGFSETGDPSPPKPRIQTAPGTENNGFQRYIGQKA